MHRSCLVAVPSTFSEDGIMLGKCKSEIQILCDNQQDHRDQVYVDMVMILRGVVLNVKILGGLAYSFRLKEMSINHDVAPFLLFLSDSYTLLNTKDVSREKVTLLPQRPEINGPLEPCGCVGK